MHLFDEKVGFGCFRSTVVFFLPGFCVSKHYNTGPSGRFLTFRMRMVQPASFFTNLFLFFVCQPTKVRRQLLGSIEANHTGKANDGGGDDDEEEEDDDVDDDDDDDAHVDDVKVLSLLAFLVSKHDDNDDDDDDDDDDEDDKDDDDDDIHDVHDVHDDDDVVDDDDDVDDGRHFDDAHGVGGEVDVFTPPPPPPPPP